jgi:hypothetical protein
VGRGEGARVDGDHREPGRAVNRTWMTDLGDLPPADADASVAARRRAAFTRAVVEAATATCSRAWWRSAVACVGRRGRKLCRAYVEVRVTRDLDAAQWTCASCGDRGMVTGWIDTAHDFVSFPPEGGDTRALALDEAAYGTLLTLADGQPDERSILVRATPVDDGAALALTASAGELQDLLLLVDEGMATARQRSELVRLDRIRAEVRAAMDPA